jgi:hypothetical protein
MRQEIQEVSCGPAPSPTTGRRLISKAKSAQGNEPEGRDMDNPGKAVDGEAIAKDMAKRSEAEAILSNVRSKGVGLSWLAGMILSTVVFSLLGNVTDSWLLKALLSLACLCAFATAIDVWLVQRRLDAAIY